ncbi:MAG: hypothetical protein ONB44_13005 [candidate division KSB1 bacterium]|nr:hypothetical protein [candidate division KSB1 bacterium]MDZ7303039.1 hypothetical protein [candidate division KSB1 bacterium]MDZ7312453.1 hypothetical protein [candidate division KSB1 bacterium]
MDIKEHIYSDDPKVGHPDVQTNPPKCVYYFLGNGHIQVAVQVNRSGQGTPLGLLFMHPEKLGKKREALNFHPERGIEDSQVCVVVDGREYRPEVPALKVSWERFGSVPAVLAEWYAGEVEVREEFYCPFPQEPRLRRVVHWQNRGKQNHQIEVWALLPEPKNAPTGERKKLGQPAFMYKPIEASTTIFEYVLNSEEDGEWKVDLALGRDPFPSPNAQDYWRATTKLDCDNPALNHLFAASCAQLPAAISTSGVMDGSIWQYNLEWVRDQAMVTIGLTMAGHQDLAQTMIERLLHKFVTEHGDTVDSGRVRDPAEVELDQNGVLLYALWNLWCWRGEPILHLIRQYWQKIVAVAEFPLQDIYWDKESRLLKNTREYWERHAAYGIREGYELAYQLFVVMGLEKAAVMAERIGDMQHAQRWRDAAAMIKQAMLAHPKFAMIEDGHFIKRRLTSGKVQHALAMIPADALPPGLLPPNDPNCYLEPDSSEALPIAFELIDPKSELAYKTLAHLETLWNQRWEIGGYGRYHVSSEPDSPGPWPFATLFIARAYLENGNFEKVSRALRWLHDVQGGEAGSWFEFYGSRPSPPCPQVGIIPWTWAEMIIFFVHHLLGVRPEIDRLIIRPRLLPELKSVKSRLRVLGHWIELQIHQAEKAEARKAEVNGQSMMFQNGKLSLPLPEGDWKVEIHI